MADRTKIEWAANADGSAGASWNPIRARNRADGRVGWFCIHASAGCKHCYAEPINRRVGAGVDYAAQNRDQVDIFLDEKTLLQPLRWKRPRTIFVCSMTDLFGEFVDDAMIDAVFAIMALCAQHTFIVLTKRSTRMRTHVSTMTLERLAMIVPRGAWPLTHHEATTRLTGQPEAAAALYRCSRKAWPLPNVWLGVSAEDQRNADARIPDLLATPAAVRLLSAEPLLGAIDLERIAFPSGFVESHGGQLPSLNWVIVGGESGPNARPMCTAWARALRDQCAAAAVPFFFKQWGAFAPRKVFEPHDTLVRAADGAWGAPFTIHGANIYPMQRVGKRAAGRLLDGRTHDERPAFRAAP